MSLRRRVAQMERALRIAVGRPLVVIEPIGDRPDPFQERIAQARARGQRIHVIRIGRMASAADPDPSHPINGAPDGDAVDRDCGGGAYFQGAKHDDNGKCKSGVDVARD